MIVDKHPPSPPVAPEHYVGGTILTYLDVENVEWSVVEVAVDRTRVPGARGVRCLLFSRKDCIRRVWDYPGDWRLLGAAMLESLSWNR